MEKIQNSSLICDFCGKEGTKIRYVPRSYGKGENLLVIEDVPIISCSHCGESYLTAETLHEIERIKLHRLSFAKSRPVPVAVFA
ncbi:MAG: type II toxin-antitoxin system MqsA family antitoxin [Anaerolineales bacterium]|nr:type II toxin-antitoxin system MqsA family antitoxin [Anaerolineales bacterium]